MADGGMKTCSACGQLKEADAFSRNSAKCKPCKAAYQLAKYHEEMKDPDIRKKHAARVNDWMKNNADKAKAIYSRRSIKRVNEGYWVKYNKTPNRAAYLSQYAKSEAARGATRRYDKKAISELLDGYVADVICKRTSIRAEDVPKPIIEAKRLVIAIKRLTKEKSK